MRNTTCVASVSIQADAATGGDEFAVTGVAVVPLTTASAVHPLDWHDMVAGREAGSQLPHRWP
jgi:hypothetical protein